MQSQIVIRIRLAIFKSYMQNSLLTSKRRNTVYIAYKATAKIMQCSILGCHAVKYLSKKMI